MQQITGSDKMTVKIRPYRKLIHAGKKALLLCNVFVHSRQFLKRSTTKATKGFTLMELIIVMALLAIIAAILVPMFLNTTDRARLRSDIQSARVIQNAMDLYRVERGRSVQGGENATTVMNNLEEAGYLNTRNAALQTENARWVIVGGRIFVNIQDSPQSVRDLYPSLSEAEREFVRIQP